MHKDEVLLSPQDPSPIKKFTHSLSNLNAAQREAVEATDGPVLVLAGAGTGKTRVLTTRLSYILLSQKAWGSQVLAVTFTNKAAQEMRERVKELIGPSAEGLWLGTFHALSLRILRRHAELLDLHSDFMILDEDDQLRLIKQLLKAENLDDKKFPPRFVLSQISRWKDRGLTPNKVSFNEMRHTKDQRLLSLYEAYQKRLKALNAVDFGDILLHTLTLFLEHPEILEKYQNQFKYILVDEYQDTNVAQYLWLRLLSQKHLNLCCVGDDDQSIYGWRGAEVGNILRFEKDYPGAKIIRLEQNYRSTPAILEAASSLINCNQGRLGKTLWTEDRGEEQVNVCRLWDGESEARWIAEAIENLHRYKHSLSEIAILVRAGYQTREFEERFIVNAIPYKIIGGARFYERLEIRDAIAYFRLVLHPTDDLAFERIINTPKRGIGPSTLQKLHVESQRRAIPLLAACSQLLEIEEIKGKTALTLKAFLKDLQRWQEYLRETQDHVNGAKMILEESGYLNVWRQDTSANAPGRLENLKELVSALEEFQSLDEFLEHISLVMENATNDTEDKVNVMTIHSAKGLEFHTVFLAGWEEGIFPHPRSLAESGSEGLEEERRLAYVALTRARKKAIITHVINRRIHNKWYSSIPSRFINEIKRSCLSLTDETGLTSFNP